MRSHTVFSTLSALAAAAALSAPAFAAQDDVAKQVNGVTEQITVVAPRIVRTRVHGLRDQNGGMTNFDLLRSTQQVSYSDLNLARPEDAKTLERRIDTAADEVCSQLANTPPIQRKSIECVRRAADNAMEVADVMIDAAKRAAAS